MSSAAFDVADVADVVSRRVQEQTLDTQEFSATSRRRNKVSDVVVGSTIGEQAFIMQSYDQPS